MLGVTDKGFYGYRIFDIVLPGIWDTLFNIFVYFHGYGIYGKLIIGIVVSVFKGVWDTCLLTSSDMVYWYP